MMIDPSRPGPEEVAIVVRVLERPLEPRGRAAAMYEAARLLDLRNSGSDDRIAAPPLLDVTAGVQWN
jgi:hypothetical protein